MSRWKFCIKSGRFLISNRRNDKVKKLIFTLIKNCWTITSSDYWRYWGGSFAHERGYTKTLITNQHSQLRGEIDVSDFIDEGYNIISVNGN